MNRIFSVFTSINFWSGKFITITQSKKWREVINDGLQCANKDDSADVWSKTKWTCKCPSGKVLLKDMGDICNFISNNNANYT